MKQFIVILFIVLSNQVMGQKGKATTIKKTFSRTTSVSIEIKSTQSIIWKLLTTSSDFPRWNSTVLSIEGNIKEGEKIELKSYLDSSRVFKIKIKEVVPMERMVWGDAMGTRIYTITEAKEGSYLFSMTETIGSFMFPLFANKIPSFDESFEKYASDLKREAESQLK